MLRNIKLSVDPVYINPGSTLAHTGTSYQVSPTPDFTNTAKLALNLVNSTTSKLSHMFQYNMGPNTPLYVRTRYHFNNGAVSDWSNTIEINGSQTGIKSSDTIVSTPVLSTTFDFATTSTGELVARLDNLTVQAGMGAITSVSWKIATPDDTVIYEMPFNTDVTGELRLPVSELNNEKILVVSAVVNTDTNTTSNESRAILVVNTYNVTYGVPTIKGTLYSDANNYIVLTEPTQPYAKSEVRILASDGTVIGVYPSNSGTVAKFRTGPLDTAGYYTVEMRVANASGAFTPWFHAYSGGASVYTARQYARSIKYNTGTPGFGGPLTLNGASDQRVQADADGVFYLARPETDIMDLYRSNNGALVPMGQTHTLAAGSLSKYPTINTLRMYDGDLVIDHSMAGAGTNNNIPRFSVMNYNSVTKAITPIHGMRRTDERYGTGRNGSAVIDRAGMVWYIPGKMIAADGTDADLEMRVYDTKTNKIINHIPLPFTSVKQNVALAEDDSGNLYIFGGSGSDTKHPVTGELWARHLNSVVYRLNKATNTWTNVATIAPINSESYRYGMVTGKNGDIFIIDQTPGLVTTAPRHSYLLSTRTFGVIATYVNNPSKEHIGRIVELVNGDIGMISSTPDSVEFVSYFTTTVSTAHLAAVGHNYSNRVLDLVVAPGDKVYIRDPYRYRSINIGGTNMGNTGVLVWLDSKGVATEYYYNDLIITRNTTLTEPLAGPYLTYNKLAIVGNAILTIVRV